MVAHCTRATPTTSVMSILRVRPTTTITTTLIVLSPIAFDGWDKRLDHRKGVPLLAQMQGVDFRSLYEINNGVVMLFGEPSTAINATHPYKI